MPEGAFPRISLPSPSTQRALDDSADRARADLAKLQSSRANTNLILQGLGGLADVARQHFTDMQRADDFLLADQATTELFTAVHHWEQDLANSENPEMGLAHYWEQWEGLVGELGKGMPLNAQRAFRESANQFHRQRIPHVLALAEARTGELVGQRFNEHVTDAVKAGDVGRTKAIIQQFGAYLPSEFKATGGGADSLVMQAERISVLPTLMELANEYGGGTAASWALNPANSPNHSRPSACSSRDSPRSTPTPTTRSAPSWRLASSKPPTARWRRRSGRAARSCRAR